MVDLMEATKPQTATHNNLGGLRDTLRDTFLGDELPEMIELIVLFSFSCSFTIYKPWIAFYTYYTVLIVI